MNNRNWIYNRLWTQRGTCLPKRRLFPLLALALLMGANVHANERTWQFPGDFETENSAWSYLCVSKDQPTDQAIEMDAGPDKKNGPSKAKGAYFVSDDPYAMIRKAFIMPGTKNDSVLAWTSPIDGAVKIRLNVHVPKGGKEALVQYRVEQTKSVDGANITAVLQKKTIAHKAPDVFESFVNVKKGDRITLRIGDGGDGINADMVELTFAIAQSNVSMAESLPTVLSDYLKKARFVPSVTIPHITNPPVLDGVLDKDEWGKAAVLTNFQDHKMRGQATAFPAVCYLMYDDTFLYVGFSSRLGEKKKAAAERTDNWLLKAVYDLEEDPPRTKATKRDGPVWLDNSVELFLVPREKKCYQFVGNAKGVIADTFNHALGWNGNWEYRTSIADNAWYGELKIAFKELGTATPKAGTVWPFNACHNTHLPRVEQSQWAYTEFDYHDQSGFGKLIFGGDRAVVRLQPVENSRPNRPLVGLLRGSTEGDRDIALYFQILRDGTLLQDDLQQIDLRSGDGVSFALAAKESLLPGDYMYRLLVGNTNDDRINYAVEFPVNVPQLFGMELKQYPNHCKMVVTVDTEESDLAMSEKSELFVDLELLEFATGKKLATVNAKYQEQEKSTDIPIEEYADLPEGHYVISCRLKRSDGSVVASRSEEFQRPAYPPEWVANIKELPEYPALPPGFSPLEIEGDSVTCWNRTYALGSQANGELMSQLTSGGEEILARPLTFSMKQGDRPLIFRAAPTDGWVGEGTYRAVASRDYTSGPVKVSSKIQSDFDGTIVFSLDLSSQTPETIDSFFVDIPIKRSVARLFNITSPKHNEMHEPLFSGVKAGLLPQKNLAESLCTSVWLGNDRVGLNWMGVDDKDWKNADMDRQMEILNEEESMAVLRLRLIDIPTELSSETLHFQFALMATPVKPYNPAMRSMRISNSAYWGQEERKPERTTLPKTVAYPLKGSMIPEKGALELWLDCDFDPANETTNQPLFRIEGEGESLLTATWDAAQHAMLVSNQTDALVAPFLPGKGALQHFALVWNQNGTSVMIGGEKVADSSCLLLPPEDRMAGASLVLGGGRFNVDELKISSTDSPTRTLLSGQQPSADEATLLLDHLDEYFQPIEYAYPRQNITSAAVMGGKPNNGGGVVSQGCSFLPGHIGRKVNLTPGVNVISKLDRFKAYGAKYMLFFEMWGHENYGEPLEYKQEEFRSLLKGIHELDMKLIVYFGFLLSDQVPEYKPYQWEVLQEPENKGGFYKRKWPVDRVVERCYAVCYASHWRYFILDKMRKLIDDYDLDGVYLDGTSIPTTCASQAHGCGYMRDGTRQKTITFSETREMMWRMYSLWKTRKPESLIFAHGLAPYGASMMAFSDAWLGGEIFRQVGFDNMSLDQYRAQFASSAWGVPFEVCTWNHTRSALSKALLFDYNTSHASWGLLLFAPAKLGWLTQAQKAFDMEHATFYSYLSNGSLLRTSDGVHASFYVNPKGDVWLAASQFGSDPVDAEIIFDAEKLGLKGEWPAYDVLSLSPQEYSIKNGRMSFRLNPKEARVFIIEAGGEAGR